MTRVGLQSETEPARPSVRSGRCSCGHSTSQTQFPSARPQGAESARRLRKDTQAGWSRLRKGQTHSSGKSRSGWHQIPPPCPIQCQSPFPSPPWSLPADEWLCHSMEHLHLQPRPHKSRSRVQWDDTPIEETPRRKQVKFDMDEELGNEPTLPMDLTLFFVEGMATEWDNAPSSSTPDPMDCPQTTHSHPAYIGGSQPKVPTKPSVGWP